MKVVVLLLALSSVFFLLNAAESPVGKQAIAFSVEDQFGKTWKWNEHFKGKNVLLFISDRKGREYNDNWVKPLREALNGKVEFVPFANVSSVPFFLKGFVRGKIRDAYQHSLLLDWEGDVSEHYNCQEDVTNVIFIDKNNNVRYCISGKGSSDEVQRTLQEIKKIAGL